jgi:hypothetical protein
VAGGDGKPEPTHPATVPNALRAPRLTLRAQEVTRGRQDAKATTQAEEAKEAEGLGPPRYGVESAVRPCTGGIWPMRPAW